MNLFYQLVTQAVGLLPIFILVAAVMFRKRRLDKDERRDPITTDLRSFPGNSIQNQADKLADSALDKLVMALCLGLLCALLIATRRIGTDVRPWDIVDAVALLASIGVASYFAHQLIQTMPLRRKLKQAIRAEQATAQELSASLAGDNRIIHDVQAKDFNIDHVVITPVGVFAVETKSRLKPPSGQGADAVKVRYNGKQLEFPTWTETKPIEQAARQARWLSDYLKQSTGETFPVFAVLALPGWWVELAGRITDDMVRVINPKNAQWLLLPGKQPARLDSTAIQRAAFQIEKLAKVEAT